MQSLVNHQRSGLSLLSTNALDDIFHSSLGDYWNRVYSDQRSHCNPLSKDYLEEKKSALDAVGEVGEEVARLSIDMRGVEDAIATAKRLPQVSPRASRLNQGPVK